MRSGAVDHLKGDSHDRLLLALLRRWAVPCSTGDKGRLSSPLPASPSARQSDSGRSTLTAHRSLRAICSRSPPSANGLLLFLQRQRPGSALSAAAAS